MLTLRLSQRSDYPYIITTWIRSCGKLPPKLRRLVIYAVEMKVRTIATHVVCDDSMPHVVMGWRCEDITYIPNELKNLTAIRDMLA
jgi:hypothetical protein